MNEALPTGSNDAGTLKLLAKIFGGVILALAGFAFALFLLMFWLPVHQADAGYRKIKRTVNPEDLRAWALEAIKKTSATNGMHREIPPSEMPVYLRNLYATPPEMASAEPKIEQDGGNVFIMWGGGFFGWGFQIGPTNFVVTTHEHGPRVFEVAPGIYYFRDATWGLQ